MKYINTSLAGKFMYKIYHKTMPAIFHDFFRYNYHIHDHDTRTASHLHAPSTISNLSKAGIRYEGGTIWNKILSVNINPDSSQQSFKVIWKNCIIQRLIANEFISNWLLIKWRLLLLSCSLPFIAIFINSVHVYLIILVAPVLTDMVISCYKCTCSTVMGPINLWGFLPPFAILLYIWCIHVIIIFSIVLKLRTESCHIDCTVVNGGVGNIDGLQRCWWQLGLGDGSSLQWRHNGCDGVSNHQPHRWLLNHLFGRRSKKT